MTENRTTELLPCPICGKKVYIGLYGGEPDYWWMVHGGRHYDECKCRLFMESCKFELEDETRVDYDERAMNIRGGLVGRWNTRATHGALTAEQVREAIEKRFDFDVWVPPARWQAIADELNAEIGGTCKLEKVKDYKQGIIITAWGTLCRECGAFYEFIDGRSWNCCPNCGKAVKR